MFVAVYWWRVHPGKEAQFQKAWHRGTDLIRERYGSYGSRLHRDADGRFVGYAEWPDEATWRAAFDQKMVYDEPKTRAAFLDAIAEVPPDADPIFTMHVVDDLLDRTASPLGGGTVPVVDRLAVVDAYADAEKPDLGFLWFALLITVLGLGFLVLGL